MLSANLFPLFQTALLGTLCGLAGARFAASYLRQRQSEPPSLILFIGSCIAFSYASLSITQSIAAWAALSIIGALLITACIIDHKVMLLPDILTLPAAALALPTSIYLLGNSPHFAVTGALTGAGFLLIVALFYEKVRKRQGLGMGDVKLLLSLGALTGAEGALFSITIGSLALIVWSLIQLPFAKHRGSILQTAMPFGPCLFIGACVVLFLLKG